jgi:energy-coupling factor transporter transmembrane protein EcfT
LWTLVIVASFAVTSYATGSPVLALRRFRWLLPAVVLLTLPLAVAAAFRVGPQAVAALLLRSFAAATAGVATISALGPSGLVTGLRALRVPARLCETVEAMLVSLTAIARQVAGMMRARAARRGRRAPWASLVAAPVETLRGFGRLVAAVLLRAIERAELLEAARRARGGGDV